MSAATVPVQTGFLFTISHVLKTNSNDFNPMHLIKHSIEAQNAIF